MIIELFGKDYTITFNMGVACTFEKITGKTFDLMNGLASTTDQLTLVYSALVFNNKEKDVLPFDEFLSSITFADYKMLQEALAKEMSSFYQVPEDMKTAGEGSSSPKKD